MAQLPFNEKGYIETGPGGTALGAYNTPPTASPTPEVSEPSSAQSNAVKTSAPSAPKDSSGFTPSGLFINSDGTINYEKTLEAAKTKLVDLQKQAQTLADQQKTNTQEFVSSSEPVVQEEKNVTTEARSLLPTSPEDGVESAQNASNQYLSLIDEQIKALEERRKAEVAQIESQFTGAKQNLELEQKKERGATSSTIARLGGYLGPSASAQGVMLNLAQTHRSEVTTLEGKKAEAIRQANNAIDDKQFALARLRVEEVKDIEKTIHQRKVDFFNQSLDLINEERQQDKFFREKIEADLSAFGEVALNDETLELDPTRAAQIDQYYGVPGFTKQYLETIRTTAKAAAEKDRVAAQKDMLDLLEKIPAGQKLTFPDGTTYTGLGSAGDIYTTLQVDDSGIGRLIAYDKRADRITVTPVGAVGKSDSSGGSGKVDDATTDNVLGVMQIQLEDAKLEDGTYDPDAYIRERNLMKDEFPGLVEKADAFFLNPANGFFDLEGIERLRKKGVRAPTPSV
jgi:hypothetical protein